MVFVLFFFLLGDDSFVLSAKVSKRFSGLKGKVGCLSAEFLIVDIVPNLMVLTLPSWASIMSF